MIWMTPQMVYTTSLFKRLHWNAASSNLSPQLILRIDNNIVNFIKPLRKWPPLSSCRGQPEKTADI